jgi:hypothetical protein
MSFPPPRESRPKSSSRATKWRGDLSFAGEIAASATPPRNDADPDGLLDSRLRGNDNATQYDNARK